MTDNNKPNEPQNEKPRRSDCKRTDDKDDKWQDQDDLTEIIKGPSSDEQWWRAWEQKQEDRFGPERSEEEEWFWGR